LSGGVHKSGWLDRFLANQLVPDLGAPMPKKSGNGNSGYLWFSTLFIGAECNKSMTSRCNQSRPDYDDSECTGQCAVALTMKASRGG
jgi:hypothetical protein